MKHNPSLTVNGRGLLAAAMLLLSQTIHAADPSGAWTWTSPGRNGSPDRVNTLHLQVKGEQLTGKLSAPGRDGQATETEISNGKLEGEGLSFSVIRQVNGAATTNRYSGKVVGDKITGKYDFVRNGEAQTREWVAKKVTDKP